MYNRMLSLTLSLLLAGLVSACSNEDGSAQHGHITDGDADAAMELELVDTEASEAECREFGELPMQKPSFDSYYEDEPYKQPRAIFYSELPETPVVALDCIPNSALALVAFEDSIYRIAADGSIEQLDSVSAQNLSMLYVLAEDGSFIAVYGDVIRFFHADGSKFAEVEVSRGIRSVSVSGGHIWIARKDNTIGSYNFDGTEGLYTLAPFMDFTLRSICQRADEDLILATDKGIYHLANLDSSPIWNVLADSTDGLATNDIRSVSCAEDGSILAATPQGIAVVFADGTIENLDGSKGMPYTNALDILPTNPVDKEVLVPTDKGLVYLSISSGRYRWRYFHTRYWVASWDVSDACFGNDSIFVGSSQGVSAIVYDSMTLKQKAQIIDDGMFERHNRLGMFSHCVLTQPGDLSSFVNVDDDNDGEWTSLYLASQCFRYAATGSEEALSHARLAMEAMLRLIEVDGLDGFLARSVVAPEECPQRQESSEGEWHLSDDGKWCWKGDTSSDEFVGHTFGLSIYYDLCANEQEKQRIASVFGTLVRGVAENGFVLLDIDGKPTQHGHFEPEWISTMGLLGDAGLYAAMILGALSAAYHFTNDPFFQEQFLHLAIDEGYTEYVSQIEQIITKVQTNHDSEEMAFLALVPLVRYETDPCLLSAWLAGLEYLWQVQVPERNPEFNFIYAWLSGSSENRLADSIQTLKQMYLHGIVWEVVNSHRADIEIDSRPDRFGELQSVSVLPYDQQQAFRWAENPYRLDRPGDGRVERMLSPWLLPYWLGRYLELIR